MKNQEVSEGENPEQAKADKKNSSNWTITRSGKPVDHCDEDCDGGQNGNDADVDNLVE